MPLTSDGYGNVQTGLSFTSGNLEVRNRVTPYPDCTGTFIDLWVDGEQRWSETYQDARQPRKFSGVKKYVCYGGKKCFYCYSEKKIELDRWAPIPYPTNPDT